jgi:hypothetical protein
MMCHINMSWNTIGKMLMLLMNQHASPRPIYMSRHGGEQLLLLLLVLIDQHVLQYAQISSSSTAQYSSTCTHHIFASVLTYSTTWHLHVVQCYECMYMLLSCSTVNKARYTACLLLPASRYCSCAALTVIGTRLTIAAMYTLCTLHCCCRE